jgi:ribosomal protein S18 acetylase RimI-like enzyme
MAVCIAPATAADASALVTFGSGEFARTFGHLYTAEDLAAYLEENYVEEVYVKWATDSSYNMQIAFDKEDGRVVGYILCGPNTLPMESLGSDLYDPAVPSAEIKRLYVHPSVFGTSVAKDLLTQALHWLETDREFQQIYLGVYSENFRALKFYEKYGFKHVGGYEFKVGDHYDPEYIMKKMTSASR